MNYCHCMHSFLISCIFDSLNPFPWHNFVDYASHSFAAAPPIYDKVVSSANELSDTERKSGRERRCGMWDRCQRIY